MDLGIEADYGRWAEQFAALGPLLVIIAGIIGLFLVGWGLTTLARMNSGNGARSTPGAGLTSIAIGGILIGSIGMVDIGSNTIGAKDTDQREMLYQGNVPEQELGIDNEPMTGAINLLIVVSWVMGFISFIRGMYILNSIGKGGQQQGHSVGHAATFIIGGLLAMNLMWTLSLFTYTVWEQSFPDFIQAIT